MPEPLDSEVAHGLVTVIGNLLDNAFEAVQDSAERRTEFAIHQFADGLRIRVADSGTGILPSIKDRMFEKYCSTKGAGRGFGLFLVARAVENLAGEIEVVSAKTQGTVFVVTVPYVTGGDRVD